MNSPPLSKYLDDNRIVLTLDAGGSKLEFSAITGKDSLFTPFVIPASPDDLESYLDTMVQGFSQALTLLENKKNDVTAISFGFPGPAHMSRGLLVIHRIYLHSGAGLP